MKTPERRYVTTSRGRVAYVRAGAGRGVVLIHGSLTTADDVVMALMARLAETFDVIAFDRPGHGGSDAMGYGQASPRGQAETLREAWITLGLENPVLVGHSFGGAVALAAALDYPGDIQGVVAVAPICFPELRLEHLLLAPRAPRVFGEAYARTLGPITDLAVLPLMRNAMFLPQVMPRHYGDTFPFAWASRPQAMVANAREGLTELRALAWSALGYGRCASRVTILGGTHDIVVANASHGLVAAGLMPLGTFRWVAGAGHMLHHFEQELVGEAIDDLLLSGASRLEDWSGTIPEANRRGVGQRASIPSLETDVGAR